MTILKELVCAAGEYQGADGQIKKRWRTVGHMHTSKDGREYITLDPLVNLAALPRKEGDDRIYVNLFEPKERMPASQITPSQRKAPNADPWDDNLSF